MLNDIDCIQVGIIIQHLLSTFNAIALYCRQQRIYDQYIVRKVVEFDKKLQIEKDNTSFLGRLLVKVIKHRSSSVLVSM